MSTTALYKALLEAKVSEKTAERAVEGLAFADNIATTTDLAGLKTVVARLEAELKAVLKEKATKADIARLEDKLEEKATKADLAKLEARLEDKLKEKASKTDLAELEMRMTTKMAELETKLTAQMSALETKMLRWNITLAGIIIAAVALIEKL